MWTAFRYDDEVRCVVLTGEGESFCTGIDRAEAVSDENNAAMAAGDYPGYPTPWMYDDPGRDVGPKTRDLWKPVIAAVQGMACGGAFYMLGEVEFIIASDDAVFFDPHVTYGMTAAFEPIQMLSKMPFHEIMRLSLLGAHERMSAERACQVGLVSEVVPRDELLERAGWAARVIADAPPLVIQGTMRALWTALEVPRTQAIGMANLFTRIGSDAAAFKAGQDRFARASASSGACAERATAKSAVGASSKRCRIIARGSSVSALTWVMTSSTMAVSHAPSTSSSKASRLAKCQSKPPLETPSEAATTSTRTAAGPPSASACVAAAIHASARGPNLPHAENLDGTVWIGIGAHPRIHTSTYGRSRPWTSRPGSSASRGSRDSARRNGGSPSTVPPNPVITVSGAVAEPFDVPIAALMELLGASSWPTSTAWRGGRRRTCGGRAWPSPTSTAR